MPIDALLKSKNSQSALSGFLGGAAGGAVISALTNKKSAKKLLKTGGLVALGGVAWHAYQRYRDGGNDAVAASPEPVQPATLAAPTPADASVLPNTGAAEQRSTRLLLAMIAAAYADGHLTEEEQNKVWQRAVDDGLSGKALGELEAALKRPPDVADILHGVDGLEAKLEVYTASLLTIDEACPAGARYLEELAQRLALPAPLVAAAHQSAGTIPA